MGKVMLLIGATFLSKFIAYARELVLAYFYGTGDTSDIYFFALTIPVVVFGFFLTGISSGFVPAYKKSIGNKSDNEEGNRFTNEIVLVLLLISALLIILYFFLNQAFFEFFAKGFDEADKETTVAFSNIMVFSIFFSCITTVMKSFLQAREMTSVIGLLSIPLNIVLVLSIVLSAVYENIYFLPYGYLIGCVFQSFVFVIIAKRNGYEIVRDIYIWNDNVRFFLSSIFILTIGSSTFPINVLIDKMLASTVSIGGVSSLEYGNRIIDLISGIFIISISTVQFPRFVNNNDDKEKLSVEFNKGIENLTVFLIPISLVLIFFSREIITLIYARGAFGNEAIELTSPILVFYGIGLVAIGIRELVSKLYYALGDMITPVINAMVGVVLNVILNFVLVNFWGIGGLALATSISAIVVSISLLLQSRKIIILKFSIVFYMKVFILSLLSLAICTSVFECMKFNAYHLNVIIGLISFFFVYSIGSVYCGFFDIKAIKKMFKL